MRYSHLKYFLKSSGSPGISVTDFTNWCPSLDSYFDLFFAVRSLDLETRINMLNLYLLLPAGKKLDASVSPSLEMAVTQELPQRRLKLTVGTTFSMVPKLGLQMLTKVRKFRRY